jgi:hypothetical protein
MTYPEQFANLALGTLWVVVAHGVLYPVLSAAVIDSYFEVSAVGITGKGESFWRDILMGPWRLIADVCCKHSPSKNKLQNKTSQRRRGSTLVRAA